VSRLRTFGLLLAAVFAVGTVTASAALAVELPDLELKTGAFPLKFTGDSGAGKLNLTGAGITCNSDANSGEFTNALEGTVSITFSGCKLGGKECKTEGGVVKEQIKTPSLKTKLVRLAKEHVGIIFNAGAVAETKIECVLVGAKKVVVKGELLGLVEKPYLVFTTHFVINVTVLAGPPITQDVTLFETDTGTKSALTTPLNGTLEGGAAKEATLESASNLIDTEAGREAKVIKTT
jgi:hypothetical protein